MDFLNVFLTQRVKKKLSASGEKGVRQWDKENKKRVTDRLPQSITTLSFLAACHDYQLPIGALSKWFHKLSKYRRLSPGGSLAVCSDHYWPLGVSVSAREHAEKLYLHVSMSSLSVMYTFTLAFMIILTYNVSQGGEAAPDIWKIKLIPASHTLESHKPPFICCWRRLFQLPKQMYCIFLLFLRNT